jgi:hypothetical protein
VLKNLKIPKKVLKRKRNLASEKNRKRKQWTFVANAMHETTNKMKSVIKKTFMYILTCKSGTIDIQPFPCLVISGISCHCIWTNTDYYNNTKKVPPCLIEIFGNWPEKLINFFVLNILLFELFPLQRTNWFPFNARATERIKNLSIIFLKFIDNWTL